LEEDLKLKTQPKATLQEFVDEEMKILYLGILYQPSILPCEAYHPVGPMCVLNHS